MRSKEYEIGHEPEPDEPSAEPGADPGRCECGRWLGTMSRQLSDALAENDRLARDFNFECERRQALRAELAAKDAEIADLEAELARAVTPDDHEAEERAKLQARIAELEESEDTHLGKAGARPICTQRREQVSFVDEFHAKTDRTCAREGCRNPADLTPTIEMLPPRATGYKGDPIVIRYGLAICAECRPWFIETSKALVEQAEDLTRKAGRLVDSSRTRIFMIPLPATRNYQAKGESK